MLDNLNHHPAVALKADNQSIIGLAYTSKFAYDILELAQILIEPQYRNLGLGSQMIEYLEHAVNEPFQALILTNTDAYPSLSEEKKPATSFYLNNGFALTSETDTTRVFFKNLID
jgi:GNAT superfamily N-acetyltransferase